MTEEPHPSSVSRTADVFLPLTWLVAVSSLAQLLFSRLGYAPTDDGFILAYSRRLLDGEIPHRDFISIRPVGSPLLHIWEVWLGGSHVFLLDRYVVWLQFAFIALAWTSILPAMLGRTLDMAPRLVLATVGFALTAHTFPLTAWHTTDGLFLVSAGCWLRVALGGPSPLPYLLVGASVLCKQNFLAMMVVAPVAFGDAKSWRVWLANLLPAAAYVASLALLGALHPALEQMRAQTGLVQIGILPYLGHKKAILPGIVLGVLVSRVRSPLTGLVLVAAIAVAFLPALYEPEGAHFLLALVVTVTLMHWQDPGALASGLLSSALGWTVGISVSYISPALAGAVLVACLALLLDLPHRPAVRVTGVAGALAVLAIFTYGRFQDIYDEPPASHLTYSLSGVFPGGDGLMADRYVYGYMRDLSRLTHGFQGRYAVVPDCPGCWVASSARNPLPIDWPGPIELSTPHLLGETRGKLASMHGQITVLEERWMPVFSTGRIPLTADLLQPVLRRYYHRRGESAYFTIYR